MFHKRYTFVSPSADSRRALVSYWQKYVHKVLVNHLGGQSLPRKSVIGFTDCARKSKEIASLMKMLSTLSSLTHYQVCPSSYLFQFFLTLYGRSEENSSYLIISQMFNHVQLYVHWKHLLNTRICRCSYITPTDYIYCDPR